MKHIFTSLIFSLLSVLFLIPEKSFGQSGNPSIMFFIHNPQVNGNIYEFDIYAVVSQTGTYHSRGNIYLNYSTNAFGSDVVTNNRVQATKLTLLNENIPNVGPKYNTVNINDNTSSRFAVAWASNFLFATPGPLAHTEMRTTPTALYHISLEILNPNVTLAVSLHEPLMTYDQFYFSGPGRESLYSMLPFPVEWSDVSAEYLGGRRAQVSWTTNKEVNTATFEVEKQVNGGDFGSIYQIDAAGYSDTHVDYAYVDALESGLQTYYRIKQIDQDGLATYSPIVALKSTDTEKLSVKGFPNPVKDHFQLEIQNQNDGWIEIRVRNIQGQLVKKDHLWVAGKQVNLIKFDLEQLEAGYYFWEIIEAKTQNRSAIQKLIKL